MSDQTLIELVYGKSAHTNPIACVEDLSADLAGRAIAGFPHSTWQLLNHMNYWMHYEIQRITGQAPPYPEHAAGSWLPDSTPASEGEWAAAVARFRDLLGSLAEIAQSSPQELSRDVPPAHTLQAQYSSSVRGILWQTVAHNSYHVGQIAMLRRCLGAWPPRAGGDTW
jgi:uncharacterized damage-inducible protein DinB